MLIYPVRMHAVYTQNSDIVSVDRDPSQCQQTIGEFVSITRLGKQRFPISIVHRAPVNVLEDRNDAITGYSTILHSRHFWPRAHVMGSRSACFILQSDWLLKILRGNSRQKMYGSATRPLSRFFGRGLGTRLMWLWLFLFLLYFNCVILDGYIPCSHSTGIKHRTRFSFTCKTKNLVYLIQCSLQYVGETVYLIFE